MRWTLLNRTVPVCTLDVNAEGRLVRILSIHAPEAGPPGAFRGWPRLGAGPLREWWNDRLPPPWRPGLATELKVQGAPSASALALRSFGMNLSDQYWLRPADRPDLRWEDLNFFANAFPADGRTPDASTNGELPKSWRILDGSEGLSWPAGTRVLFKGPGPRGLSPACELACSRLLDLFGVPHVPYALVDGGAASACPCLADEGTEFVPAWRIVSAFKRRGHESLFGFFRRVMEEELELDAAEDVRRMLLFDWIAAGEDRHFHNFGFLRKTEGGPFLGTAPLFDCERSLWSGLSVQEIGRPVPSLPFHERPERQLKLTEGAEFPCMPGQNEARNAVLAAFTEAGVPEERAEATADAVCRRLDAMRQPPRLSRAAWRPE